MWSEQKKNRMYVGIPPHQVLVQEPSGASHWLALRLDLRDHSPTGFSWGYGGSGPAQLALALLADAAGDDELALAWYYEFKWSLVASWDVDRPWSVDQQTVKAWLDARVIQSSIGAIQV